MSRRYRQQFRVLLALGLLWVAGDARAVFCPDWLQRAWPAQSASPYRHHLSKGLVAIFDPDGRRDRVVRRVPCGFLRVCEYVLHEGTILRIPIRVVSGRSPVVPAAIAHRVTGYPLEYEYLSANSLNFTIGFNDGVLVYTGIPGSRARSLGVQVRGHEFLATVFFIPKRYRFSSFPLISTQVENLDQPHRRASDPWTHPFQDAENVLVTVVESDESGVMTPEQWRRRTGLLERTRRGVVSRVPQDPAHTWLFRRTHPFPPRLSDGLYVFEGKADFIADFAVIPASSVVIDGGILTAMPRRGSQVSLLNVDWIEPLNVRIPPMRGSLDPEDSGWLTNPVR